MNVEEFEDFVRYNCDLLCVELDAADARYVEFDGEACNGYFLDEAHGGPKLAYAKGQPLDQWFAVLVHEYNHMRQWAEGDPLWHDDHQSDADKYLWSWLDGSLEMEPELARASAMSSLRLELGCDRRTTKMIQELDLPVDLELYYRKANSYILFYHLLLKHRRWYEIGKEPYNIPELVAQMPTSLYELDYETMSDEMITLFETHMPYLLGPNEEA